MTSTDGKQTVALNTGRLTRLDVLRGIAASVVILFHYHTLLAAPGTRIAVSTGLPLHDFLWPFYSYGTLAVPFFWLLSGIVFWHTYGGTKVDAGSFFWRRFARLYPLHFLTLVIMAALNLLALYRFGHDVGEGNNLRNFVEQLFLATHWAGVGHRSYNYPIWSVSMEILAYAAFFLFLRFSNRGWPVLIAAIGLATLLALGFASYQATCVALFFIGCALVRIAPNVDFRVAGAAAIVAAIATLGVALSPLARHLILALEYCLFPALLLIVIKLDLSRPQVRFKGFGDLSYGIYLTHVPLLTMVGLAFESGVPNPAREPWFLLLFLGLVVAVAALSYRFVERPAQRWILARRVRRSPSRQEPEW